MGDRVIKFREELLVAGKIQFKGDLPVCPACSGQTLVLHGSMSFPHREICTEGVIADQTTDWDCKRPFELAAFDCVSCEVHYRIQTDQDAMLLQEVSRLQAELGHKGTHSC